MPAKNKAKAKFVTNRDISVDLIEKLKDYVQNIISTEEIYIKVCCNCVENQVMMLNTNLVALVQNFTDVPFASVKANKPLEEVIKRVEEVNQMCNYSGLAYSFMTTQELWKKFYSFSRNYNRGVKSLYKYTGRLQSRVIVAKDEYIGFVNESPSYGTVYGFGDNARVENVSLVPIYRLNTSNDSTTKAVTYSYEKSVAVRGVPIEETTAMPKKSNQKLHSNRRGTP